MKRLGRIGFFLPLSFLLCISTTFFAYAQATKINPSAAKKHVGERATVCGKVVSPRYSRRSRGQPTFLNLDKPYPNQIFTILIWGRDRAKFGIPEKRYRDKRVCVTGEITSYRGVPEIVVSDPAQLRSESAESGRSSTSSTAIPAGATAECRDGSYSFSQHRRGTCSHHGGVDGWLTH